MHSLYLKKYEKQGGMRALLQGRVMGQEEVLYDYSKAEGFVNRVRHTNLLTEPSFWYRIFCMSVTAVLWREGYITTERMKGKRRVRYVCVSGHWYPRGHTVVTELLESLGIEDDIQVCNEKADKGEEVVALSALYTTHGYRTNVGTKKVREEYKVMIDGAWYAYGSDAAQSLAHALTLEEAESAL